MLSPDDYENAALSNLMKGDTSAALVRAVLALASAMNNPAGHHSWIADTVSGLAEAKQEPGQR